MPTYLTRASQMVLSSLKGRREPANGFAKSASEQTRETATSDSHTYLCDSIGDGRFPGLHGRSDASGGGLHRHCRPPDVAAPELVLTPRFRKCQINNPLILPHGHAYSRGGHLVGMHTCRRRPKTKVRAQYDAAHFSRASPMTGLRSSASNTVATEHVESPQRRQELYYVRRPRPAYWIASATSPLSRCAGLGRTRGGNGGGGESA